MGTAECLVLQLDGVVARSAARRQLRVRDVEVSWLPLRVRDGEQTRRTKERRSRSRGARHAGGRNIRLITCDSGGWGRPTKSGPRRWQVGGQARHGAPAGTHQVLS